MKTSKLFGSALLAISLCLSACEEIKPTPEPTPDQTHEELQSGITIDDNLIHNGLSFTSEAGEKSVSFSTNEDWTLSMASTPSGETWCTASATSGTEGDVTVKFSVMENTAYDDRSVSVTIKSGTASKTFTITQKYADALLLSKNLYEVGQEGGTIEIEVKANVDYEVQMPDVDWITEVSTRGMSSHSLLYTVAPNEDYDSRSAEIIFYDKNNDLKETLKVVQAQKNAIIISEKNITVENAGGIIEVKINSNIDFEVQIPLEISWISIADTRALIENSIYLSIAENTSEEERIASITILNNEAQLYDSITITQAKAVHAGYENGTVTIAKAGTMKTLLGSDYLNISSLKIVGPINGDDVYYLRKMLGARNSFSETEWGKLTTLDLSEARIVEGGEYYYYYQDWRGNDYNYYTSNNAIGEYMFNGCINLQNIILPANVTSIHDYAFSNSSNLVTITLPAGVTSIGDYAFKGCSSLTSIDIPDSVTILGEASFQECHKLLSVKIGKGIIELGTAGSTGIFYGCESLISIEIPDNIISIGEDTFNYCTSLENIKIGEGVTYIGNRAFGRCAMTTIEIPDNVTVIDDAAFIECPNLKLVTIGKNVTTMGYSVFAYSDITTVYCYATNPPESNDTEGLFSCSNASLYVPARCGGKYKPVWGKYFENIIEMD